MGMTGRRAFTLVLVAALGARAWGLQAPGEALDQARAEEARTARDYRAALESVLKFQIEEARRATETAEVRRRLVEQGIVSRREAEDAEAAAAAAREEVEQTRARIVEADTMVTEAEAPQILAALPPLRPGELHTAGSLIRFLGAGQWSLSMAPRVQRFFTERFGRPLPVSAFGQTLVHDRLGFDHRNALDVALHPDTLEGQALMTWLLGQRISFLAFRHAVAGGATGAHVHVGEPSPRLTSPPR
jgi:hypothetical protein